MSVAFDALTRNNRTGTSDPTTFTHTPVGTPRFVLGCYHNVSSQTDHLNGTNGLTYGGVAVPKIWGAADNTTAFTRYMGVCFLGSGIPTGAQSASWDWTSATTDDIELVIITGTAAADTEVVNEQLINGETANASVTMSQGGRECQAYGFGAFALANVGDAAENANMSVNQEIDKGASIWLSHRQTTPGTTDFVFSYSHSSVSVFLKVVSIAEVVASVVSRRMLLGVGA